MIDIGALLNRLDQLEAKIDQHEVKIKSQQIEIDQLKKKNSELLAEKNHQPILARSCFEVRAKNPSAPSGVYSIDPDGQIGGDQPIQVYCDMTTRNNRPIYYSNISYYNIHLL